tara:strand:- start:351 stop:626 length:276 start_codon:yes stop_codon:yes gene_type:complete
MVHPSTSNNDYDFINDLSALFTELAVTLTNMDLNSGIDAVPSLNVAFIVAFTASFELILDRYQAVPLKNIIYPYDSHTATMFCIGSTYATL